MPVARIVRKVRRLFDGRALEPDAAAWERRFFHTMSRWCNRGSRSRRRSLARGLLSGPPAEPNLGPVPRRTGCAIVPPPRFPLLDEAVNEARVAFAAYVPGSRKREKDSLEGAPRLDMSFRSAINRLAMHPSLVGPAAAYLGELPVLYRINLLYSPNDAQYDFSSQFFHLDPEDVEQMKVFVYVEDVDANSGPFVLVPADRSAEIRNRTGYRGGRLSDEAVGDGAVECVGPAGTMVFADTSRCFHMGSRKGTRPRYCILIQYVLPYAVMFPLGGPLGGTRMTASAVPPKPDEFQRHLLGLTR